MTYAGPARKIDVDQELLDTILKPYKPHCRYLKRMTVEVPEQPNGDPPAPYLARADCDFEIPESCYIDETGHLNAVEFNICFNQAYYVITAECINSRLVPALNDMTLEHYKRRHLPDVLIHDLSSTFKRVIDRSRFKGEIAIADCVQTSRFIYFRTYCSFQDEHGGYAKGDVTLALMFGPEEDEES